MHMITLLVDASASMRVSGSQYIPHNLRALVPYKAAFTKIAAAMDERHHQCQSRCCSCAHMRMRLPALRD